MDLVLYRYRNSGNTFAIEKVNWSYFCSFPITNDTSNLYIKSYRSSREVQHYIPCYFHKTTLKKLNYYRHNNDLVINDCLYYNFLISISFLLSWQIVLNQDVHFRFLKKEVFESLIRIINEISKYRKYVFGLLFGNIQQVLLFNYFF